MVPGRRGAGQRIVLAHGGGGQLSDQLVRESILPRLGNDVLCALWDSAVLDELGSDRPALTIDGYVVQPWKFPGGDIGRLAVAGTVNDLAVCGARPVGIALSLILAEGLPRKVLDRVLESVAATASEAGVPIVAGDTKVAGRGGADGIYIVTAGLGRVPKSRRLAPEQVQPGDKLLVNGPIADHGIAVMLARELPDVRSPVRSDVAPLSGLIHALLEEVGDGVAFMRDATRGGLAGVGADLAAACSRQIVLEEDAIPVRGATRHAADMLGLDPLDVANEGKVVVAVRPDVAERALAALRRHPLGQEAAIIGEVLDSNDGVCELRTRIGGRRIVQKPYGEQLPRIC
jgi:hydrogenase expression/formation protein HypE